MLHSLTSLKVAKYFPLTRGIYEVKPGLFPLKQDFGNPGQDNSIFQIDQNFPHYRKNKLEAHSEQLSRYFCTKNFPSTEQQVIARYIINTLCHEYPDFFSLEKKNHTLLFICKLTNENILLSDKFELIKNNVFNSETLNYLSCIDALMMQVQEDIAIITEDDYIACLHLMAPNFWSASDKIGKNFSNIHQDVAGIDTIVKNSKAIIQAMIYKGPFVRFAWGLTTDNKLNHHPQHRGLNACTTIKSEHGRNFDPLKPSLYLRVERQTIRGFPEIKCAMFTIRSYLYNIKELDKTKIQCLIDSIHSMSEKQLIYKGLKTTKSAIIKWLSSLF